MPEYFSTGTLTLENLEDSIVNVYYAKGYVFTRLGKGVMNQTRSLRIDLSKFELTSENRRILKKGENVTAEFHKLPLENYSWEIHKLGKDFYTTKFGDQTMSASKIKEMFTDMSLSNMNAVISYRLSVVKNDGYALCYANSEILHYAYPFYDLQPTTSNLQPNLGMVMMLKAILWAKDNGLKYVYLGSVTDEKSKYKLQFKGLEWWDNGVWSENLDGLKSLLGTYS